MSGIKKQQQSSSTQRSLEGKVLVVVQPEYEVYAQDTALRCRALIPSFKSLRGQALRGRGPPQKALRCRDSKQLLQQKQHCLREGPVSHERRHAQRTQAGTEAGSCPQSPWHHSPAPVPSCNIRLQHGEDRCISQLPCERIRDVLLLPAAQPKCHHGPPSVLQPPSRPYAYSSHGEDGRCGCAAGVSSIHTSSSQLPRMLKPRGGKHMWVFR